MNVELISIHSAKSPRTKDADAILRSIKMDENFYISGDQLIHRGIFSCTYKIFDWFLKDGLVGVLHEFSYIGDDSDNPSESHVTRFSEMLKDFRKNIFDLKAIKLETLWDDIGLRYGRLAYPRIINLENKTRSLIVRFMLKNLGAEWIESSPSEVRAEIDKTRRTEKGIDPLHNVDFKTLGTFLTKKYSLVSTDALYERINALDPTDALSIETSVAAVKDAVPRSNWTRFFKSIVACQDTEFSKKWGDLYDLRCRVAHSSFLKKEEYEEVIRLSDALDEIIQQAIGNLQQVHVNSDEAAVLADEVNRLVEASTSVVPSEADSDLEFPPSAGNANLARLDLRNEYRRCVDTAISLAEWAGLSKAPEGALAGKVAQARLVKAGLLPQEIVDYLKDMQSSLNSPTWTFDRVSYRRFKVELKKIMEYLEIRLQVIRDRVMRSPPSEDDVIED